MLCVGILINADNLLIFFDDKLSFCVHDQQANKTADLTNSMAYGTRRFNAAFTRALQ